jgi:hypothetical protein
VSIERLTYHAGKNPAVPAKLNLDFAFELTDSAWKDVDALIQRLAAYEDIGLSPEEVTALKSERAVLQKALELVADEIGCYRTKCDRENSLHCHSMHNCNDCIQDEFIQQAEEALDHAK